jgi:LmbE family N-acetylglucosaminyl deacetylase
MTGEPLRLSPDAYPNLLPGLLAEGETIHFGRFREMLVGRAEVAFAMDCDGVTPYARLLDRHPDAECVAACLPYLVWWDRPLAAAPAMPAKAAGERWLVVSPHPDDMELSMGGLILNHRDDRALRHLICFTHLLHTQYSEAFPTDCEATALRKDEAALSSRLLGADTLMLDLPEFPVRSGHAGDEGLLELEIAMEQHLKLALLADIDRWQPQQVFAPAAIGNHADHRLIFDVILDLYEENHFPGVSFHLYEDAPYCAAHLAIDEFLARFETSFCAVEPWIEEVSQVLHLKKMLSEVFGSQLSRREQRTLEAIAERTAALAPRGSDRAACRYAERFWTLRDRPFTR